MAFKPDVQNIQRESKIRVELTRAWYHYWYQPIRSTQSASSANQLSLSVVIIISRALYTSTLISDSLCNSNLHVIWLIPTLATSMRYWQEKEEDPLEDLSLIHLHLASSDHIPQYGLCCRSPITGIGLHHYWLTSLLARNINWMTAGLLPGLH